MQYRKIFRYCRNTWLRKFFLFGSHARDDTTPESDLDLIVEFPNRLNLLDHSARCLFAKYSLFVERGIV
ncbi:MAG: nucleotidyltransferase domain-containing protein [Promethearchaeia archaeon]